MSFFGTSTGLATQVAFLVSQMNLASSSLLTSSPMALRFGSEKWRNGCLIGLALGKIWRECSANSLGTPGMSAGHQAKISQFSRRNSTSTLSYAIGRVADTRTVLDGSVGCTWWVFVSLVTLKSRVRSFDSLRLAIGKRLLSVSMAISASSSCAPKVSKILWNSLSHRSDLTKLPLTVMTSLGPGI